MKGIVCAGGKGLRLDPLTRATNKHLLPIFDKPMIYYPLKTLLNAGVTDVLIVVNEPHAGDFINVLRNGEDFGLSKVRFAFNKQPETGPPGSIACGESFADGEDVCVIFGDNITDANIKTQVDNFTTGATIFVKEVEDPECYGVPVFDSNNRIVRIEEKPEQPQSLLCVTGLYIYDNSVFNRIKHLSLTDRGEMEVTDLNNTYIRDNLLEWTTLNGFWNDAGSFEGLFKSTQYFARKK